MQTTNSGRARARRKKKYPTGPRSNLIGLVLLSKYLHIEGNWILTFLEITNNDILFCIHYCISIWYIWNFFFLFSWTVLELKHFFSGQGWVKKFFFFRPGRPDCNRTICVGLGRAWDGIHRTWSALDQKRSTLQVSRLKS